MGIDNISPKLPKNYTRSLAPIIHTPFMLSITTCQIPEEWRTHLITCIFKTGDRTDVRNYHPISLLCLLSKVLEKLVYNSIIGSIENLLSKHQFGFIKGRSCLQQLLLYLHHVVEARECSNSIDVVYLDLLKAFHTPSFSISFNFMESLVSYGSVLNLTSLAAINV